MNSIYSADDLFVVNGKYTYDVNKLGEAHSLCLIRFLRDIKPSPDGHFPYPLNIIILRGLPGSGKTTWATENSRLYDVCVDNTNTSLIEIAPYAASALAYGHNLRIVTIKSKPEMALARCTHGVSPITVGMMHQRMVTEKIPSWWPSVEVIDEEMNFLTKDNLFPRK